MRTAFFTIIAATLLSMPTWTQDTYVEGYVRSDGTYVQPHYRSQPDSYSDNNYSTHGNTNPYTRDYGTVNPPSIGGGGNENDFRPREYLDDRPSSYGRIR